MQHSVFYTLVFSAAICVVCAVLVSGSAVSLADLQQMNAELDKRKNVLLAAGVLDPEEQVTAGKINELFEGVQQVVVELETGEVVEDIDPALYDEEKAAADSQQGRAVPPNLAQIKRAGKYGIVYQVLDDAGEVEMLVLPVRGKGLWSTLYGFLALDRDTTTIRGLTFYEHGETPGLGGEVDNPSWKALWPRRKAFNEEWEPVIRVTKGPAGPPGEDPHRVDGLSGATITSRGVTGLLQFWLGEHGYGPYLEKFRERRLAEPAQQEVASEAEGGQKQPG